MKNITYLIIVFFMISIQVFAQEEDAKLAALERTVALLTTKDTKVFTKEGAAGLKVTCTVMPKEQFIAIAWVIDNPNSVILDISHDSVNLYDKVRNMDEMEPAKVAEILFGDRPGRKVGDYFINSYAPDAFVKPSMRRRTPAEEDLYASAINYYARTDAKKIKGIAYYDRYGLSQDITVELILNGEKFRFKI